MTAVREMDVRTALFYVIQSVAYFNVLGPGVIDANIPISDGWVVLRFENSRKKVPYRVPPAINAEEKFITRGLIYLVGRIEIGFGRLDCQATKSSMR
jgi:hypothetical protein